VEVHAQEFAASAAVPVARQTQIRLDSGHGGFKHVGTMARRYCRSSYVNLAIFLCRRDRCLQDRGREDLRGSAGKVMKV
jgi:hypothetical protein